MFTLDLDVGAGLKRAGTYLDRNCERDARHREGARSRSESDASEATEETTIDHIRESDLGVRRSQDRCRLGRRQGGRAEEELDLWGRLLRVTKHSWSGKE